MEIIDDGTCIQAPVTLRLRLDRFMQSHEARAGSGFHDGAMELTVQIKDAAGFGVAGSDDLFQLAVERLQLADDLGPLSIRQHGGPTASQALQTADDGVQLTGIFFCQWSDNHPRFADMFVIENIPFPLKPVQGAMNRRSAHAKVFREIAFHNPRSGRELTMDNQLTDFLERDAETRPVFCLRPGFAGQFPAAFRDCGHGLKSHHNVQQQIHQKMPPSPRSISYEELVFSTIAGVIISRIMYTIV
jgi:hypothetical protein